MNENPNFDPESIRSLLKEIAELCEHASLTGAYAGGAHRVLIRYNAILEHLLEAKAIPADMFEMLPPNTGYGEIGVEARMLASFVKGSGKKDRDRDHSPRGDTSVLIRLAPFVKSEDLATMVRQQIQAGDAMDMNLITQLAPFLDRDMLSEILQDHLRPTPPAPPEPPAPPAPVVYEPLVPHAPAREERISVLVERLKDPTLSHIEQAEILDRLRSLPSE